MSDTYTQLLEQAKAIDAPVRPRWIASLKVDQAVKDRLLKDLEGYTIADMPTIVGLEKKGAGEPLGLEPDAPRPDAMQPTRGATLSTRVPEEPGEITVSKSDHPVARSGMDPMLGKTFAGTKVEKILGSGGMGRVYLATDIETGRKVALKVLLRTQREDGMRKRFEREARLLQELKHPGIATVFRTGVEEDGDIDIPYIVMEYVEEVSTITDYVFRNRLGMRDIAQLYVQVCDAVGFAHRKGYMHRDLKPANILVDRVGRVKVIDFGVARAVQIDSAAVTVRTETGQIVGTMQYMSPEQFKADPRLVNKRSDVYALSAVLYELLSGIQPHDLRGLPVHEAARVVCDKDAPDIRQCSPRVDEVLALLLADGLSRDSTRRPEDAVAFGRRLKGWLSTPAPMVEPTIHAEHPDRAFGREAGSPKPKAVALPWSTPPMVGVSHLDAPQRKARSKGGWVGVVTIAALGVSAVLVAFDVVPIKQLVTRVRTAAGGSTAEAIEAAPPPGVDVPLNVEQIRVLCAPEGARVRVNGEDRGLAPAVVLTPVPKGGDVEIEVLKDGWQPTKVRWTQGKDLPLVTVNLTPAGRVDAMERIFLLSIPQLPEGASLSLVKPQRATLQPGAQPVMVGFTRQDEKWQSAPIELELRDAAGKPLPLTVGLKKGVGAVSFTVMPEDIRQPLRVRAE